MSEGFPAQLYLHLFGGVIESAFGHIPYQVGSSVKGKEWRDVDVVLIVDDDEFAAMFPDLDLRHGSSCDRKWSALCIIRGRRTPTMSEPTPRDIIARQLCERTNLIYEHPDVIGIYLERADEVLSALEAAGYRILKPSQVYQDGQVWELRETKVSGYDETVAVDVATGEYIGSDLAGKPLPTVYRLVEP